MFFQNQRNQSRKPNAKIIAWHKLHADAIDKTDKNLYPKLWDTKGPKGKISLSPFETLIQDAHQIFDSNRNDFRNISHVYHLAFYRGMADLTYQYVIKKKAPISVMSQLMRDTEQQREEEDEIGRAVEYIKDCLERLQKGWITKEEYDEKEEKLISAFTDQRLKDKVKHAIESLYEWGEEGKSWNRIRMKEWRQKAKANKMKVVAGNEE